MTVLMPENRQLKKRSGNKNPILPPKEHQFAPGVSGNPGGRPKLLSDAYRARLLEVESKTGKTYAELIAEAQVRKAHLGDVGAAREIRTATEGDRLSGDLTVTRRKSADEMTDDELAAIAVAGNTSGGRAGTLEPASSAAQSD